MYLQYFVKVIITCRLDRIKDNVPIYRHKAVGRINQNLINVLAQFTENHHFYILLVNAAFDWLVRC